MYNKLRGKPLLTLFFIVFPMLTTDETGCMGSLAWGGVLILSVLFQKQEPRTVGKVAFAAIIMWLSAILSSVFADNTESLNNLTKYLAFVLIFILLSNHYYNETFFKSAYYIYNVVSIVLAVLIIMSFLGGYIHVDSDFKEQIRYSIGITGIYKNPNYIGSFINVTAFILMAQLLYRQTMGMFIRIVTILLIILVFFSIVLTGTRAAIITFGCGIIILVIYKSIHQRNLVFIIPFIVIVITGIIFVDNIIDTYESRFQYRGGFVKDLRIYSWSWAVKHIYDSPFVGYGINSWEDIRSSDMLTALHNIYLEFMLSQGIIGLLPLLFVMFYGVNRIKKQDRYFVLGFCLITTFPLMFQNGFVDINLWKTLLMNRIIIDYSSYSKYGVMALFNTQEK